MPSISFLGPAAAGILTGTIIIEKVLHYQVWVHKW